MKQTKPHKAVFPPEAAIWVYNLMPTVYIMMAWTRKAPKTM
jgi:hypothetical protein